MFRDWDRRNLQAPIRRNRKLTTYYLTLINNLPDFFANFQIDYMNKIYYLTVCFLAFCSQVSAQSPVKVGSGSYASFTPASKLVGRLDSFINKMPLYVAKDKLGKPIPTNDWWTDLVVSGKNTGALWVYPMVVDPEQNGFKVFFPNKYIINGGDMNVGYGGAMSISAFGYTPKEAIAKDWSDWGLVISMPDSSGTKKFDVTTAHGVPFTWIETSGLTPFFGFDKEASYINADGSPVVFPTNQPFIVHTDDRYFGVHLDEKISAEVKGQQYVILDLGDVKDITRLSLHWEGAYASGYAIQVSDEGVLWKTVFTQGNGDGNLDEIVLATPAKGRYVKLNLLSRGTIFGYSLYEMKIFNGNLLLSEKVPFEVSSVQGNYSGGNINDGNLDTRWGSDIAQRPTLVLDTKNENSFFVISALSKPEDLKEFDKFAYNKIENTTFSYKYDVKAGTVRSDWKVQTANLKGLASGSTLQGFLPHLYANNSGSQVPFTPYSYLTSHGTLKIAEGSTFSFTYDFGGILPSYNRPFADPKDKSKFNADFMLGQISNFARRADFGEDTYWGGKDILNFAKFTLMAKEFNHQSYDLLKAKTKARLVDWLTYTSGEKSRYFARYDRWGAIVGFNESYGSAEFVDHHFHYGYLTYACALYGMTDPEFLKEYGEMIKLVIKQYANWERNDSFAPHLRTFDPWIGHSYAGGISSSSGNNQESSSESMQAWIGMFLIGDMLNDKDIRDAAAFGYSAESYATLEYWFDWKKRNFPAGYPYKMVGIVSNQGAGHKTYFGDSPSFIHGIQFLPITPGFKYFARDTAWAHSEYEDLMQESKSVEGADSETKFGDDWAIIALGFRQLFDPEYSAAFMEKNALLPKNDPQYKLDEKTTGVTYFYTHANQNLGEFSFNLHADFPSSSVFEKGGKFSHAVVYNPSTSDRTCTVYDKSGTSIVSFLVPAGQLMTYPALTGEANEPVNCYTINAVSSSATSGNAQSAIDGELGSRWESKFEDPQSLTMNLGVLTKVNKVTILWEDASAKDYNILGSIDSLKWDTVAIRRNMPAIAGHRFDVVDSIGKSYKFLKMDGRTRATPYGYSIIEMEVCGSLADVTPVIKLPAFIEAENSSSMSGLVLEPSNDFGGGVNVGYAEKGDWIEYRVNAPKAGEYKIKLRLASPLSTGKIEVLSNGRSIAVLPVPNTGAWQTYKTIEATVVLDKGDQVLRLYVAETGFNINWLDVQLPLDRFSTHIEAEWFTKMSGIQLEQTSDFEAGENVGYIDTGDWMEYSVNIPQPGKYTVRYRVASPYAGGSLKFENSDGFQSITDIPNSKGFQAWTTITTTVNFSKAGQQTIRLTATGGGFNINWLEIEGSESLAFTPEKFMPSEKLTQGLPSLGDNLRVRNSVTPNGDGINDFLQIDGIERMGKNKLTVIDPDGKKIYEQLNYDNHEKVFNGRSNINGRMQASGTYFFLLEYQEKEVRKNKTGYFILKF
jgi:gliding motility-associated-like protein